MHFLLTLFRMYLPYLHKLSSKAIFALQSSPLPCPTHAKMTLPIAPTRLYVKPIQKNRP